MIPNRSISMNTNMKNLKLGSWNLAAPLLVGTAWHVCSIACQTGFYLYGFFGLPQWRFLTLPHKKKVLKEEKERKIYRAYIIFSGRMPDNLQKLLHLPSPHRGSQGFRWYLTFIKWSSAYNSYKLLPHFIFTMVLLWIENVPCVRNGKTGLKGADQ
jgi:hypothetical protein